MKQCIFFNTPKVLFLFFVCTWLCVHWITYGQGEKAPSITFKVQLNIQNGHIGKAFFGCAEKATEGYDKNLDLMAPPPGRETGYTAFVNRKEGHFLYRNIKPVAPKQSWKFAVRVFQDETVVLRWKKEDLPEDYRFVIVHNEKKYSMRKQTELRINEGCQLAVKASERKDQQDTESKEKSKQKEDE